MEEIYLIAFQFLPFFLHGFYFFLTWEFNDISEALYLLTFINSSIILLLGKGNKHFYVCDLVDSLYIILDKHCWDWGELLKLWVLFHESLIPFSVNSTSYSVPTHVQSLRSRSTYPFSMSLATDMASLSSSLWHRFKALARFP